MGFSIVYKKLIFKGIKKAFRITCIMLILDFLHLSSICINNALTRRHTTLSLKKNWPFESKNVKITLNHQSCFQYAS